MFAAPEAFLALQEQYFAPPGKAIMRTALAGAAVMSIFAGSAALSGALPTAAVTGVKPLPSLSTSTGRTLYDQNSNYTGDAIDSQNFSSSYSLYDDKAADDFIIPKGETWRIGEVGVTGVYFNGPGPARSVNVIFWKDAYGVPGTAVKQGTYRDLHCAGMKTGAFSCKLPTRLKLVSGYYWVTVQANCDFPSCGEWGWGARHGQHKNPAQWEDTHVWQPCPTWNTIEQCVSSPGPDLMFDLKT